MSFTPIEDYGVIGNLETCPLVGRDGSIDWCCFPHTESSSVFAALLDDEAGGRFSVQPAGIFESDQEYVDRTNVLQTEFRTDSGTMTLTDFMPVTVEALPGQPPNTIYRKVACSEGTVDANVTFEPRFDYGRAATTVGRTAEGAIARGNGEQLYLWSQVPFHHSEDHDGRVEASFSLEAGETAWFALQYNNHETLDAAHCEAVLQDTVEEWREWNHECSADNGCRFGGEYHEEVVRSGLVLRLLMNPQTHAIAAAPTTSLPEEVGGVRNWDYRYAWIRDAAFTIEALYELGHEREARKGFEWCLTMCHQDDPAEISHPFYGLHSPSSMTEETLDHLSGYRDSAPVRVGNAAGDQVQLDSYGELIMAVYTATQHGETIPEDEWKVLRNVIDFVCEVWTNKDNGIWEVRSEPQHNVHSKVLCWVAIDRGIKMAEKQGFDAPLEHWREQRDALHETVLERGYDEEIGSFTQTFGRKSIDAAALQIGIVGFLPFDDERIQGTIDTVMDHLTTDEGLVLRYRDDDGLPGEDNPFLLCTFWLVDCLVLSGRVEEAREIFDNAMEYISPLGLFAEEVHPGTGEQRGNFPQAFSHVGLINSVRFLNQADDGKVIEPVGGEQRIEQD